ncbi:amidase [Bordetella sp. N]|uniref:amidase n=1 Tax=Bordetella sp. N TaxID=1746199 RepID=UPI00070BCE67|nr:amidase [Bordetella sp. N]ALM83024.1 amidase [Bordetella sp. N]
MQANEYTSLDGLALADLLHRKEVTSLELMEAAIAVARERGPALNALTYERYDEALQWARDWQATGPFRGIPFLLKDSGFASRRFPSSLGSRLFNDMTYTYDATVASRFEQAGLIPFARSTVSELCMGPSTEAVRNGGATLNPRDLTRSVGGSSGGAAAAVAAGIVPVAHGSDGGGSIRIPAACCGVYGLKPSRGRVPMGPARGEGWGGMASDGVLTRTVRDTAAAMDAISGYERGAPYAAPPKPDSYLDTIGEQHATPLRIAVWRRGWNDIEPAPECLAALERTVAWCRELGHEVVDATVPDLDYSGFVRAHGTVLATNIVIAVDARLQVLGRSLRDDDIEPVLRDGYEVGKGLHATQYADSITRFHAISRIIENAMAGFDVVLTPTLTQLPAKLDELGLNRGGFWDFRSKVSRYATFLAVINASGQPAASLPLNWTADGVPVASQLIGHFGREDVILRLSAQLERIAPWAQRPIVLPA